MAGMIWAFTGRVRATIDVLSTMRTEFSEMANNMSKIHQILGGLKQDMVSFSVVTKGMHAVRSTVSAMRGEGQEIARRMATLSGDVTLIVEGMAPFREQMEANDQLSSRLAF